MNTPWRIKKGLICCCDLRDCSTCPYKEYNSAYCIRKLLYFSLDYIERLEEERDALRNFVGRHGDLCKMCKHYDRREIDVCMAANGDCLVCKNDCPCRDCIKSNGADGYEWDGGNGE